jgi:hypothetical protein
LPPHITLVDDASKNQNMQLAKNVLSTKPKLFKYKNEEFSQGSKDDRKIILF